MSRIAFLILALSSCALLAHADTEWPPRLVKVEEMKMLTPMRISVPKSRPQGTVRGPVVLRVHVDAHGKVQRTALVESSGSSAHDEAALHSMRSTRFAPKVIDGQPVDVTLVIPLHYPLPKASAPQ